MWLILPSNIEEKIKVGVITLTSDKGIGAPEVSIMKLKLHLSLKELLVVDLSHDIKALHSIQAAHLIQYFMPEFPAGSVHFALVDHEIALHKRWLMMRYHHSYVIAADNGALPVFETADDNIRIPEGIEFTGNAFEDFVSIAKKHFSDKDYFDQLTVVNDLIRYKHENVSYADHTLKGQIIYIDKQGNLITNITREIFEHYREKRKFKIVVTRQDKVGTLSKNYSDIGLERYELVCRFNRLNRLEIALNRENAAQLLGLHYGKHVMVEFY